MIQTYEFHRPPWRLFCKSHVACVQFWLKRCKERPNPQPLNISFSPLTAVQGSKTIIVSAFSQDGTAEPSVLILAIVWRKEEKLHHCILSCRNKQIIVLPAKRQDHGSTYGFPAATGEFTCRVPMGCEPRYCDIELLKLQYNTWNNYVSSSGFIFSQ